jgi:hypothetical protein
MASCALSFGFRVMRRHALSWHHRSGVKRSRCGVPDSVRGPTWSQPREDSAWQLQNVRGPTPGVVTENTDLAIPRVPDLKTISLYHEAISFNHAKQHLATLVLTSKLPRLIPPCHRCPPGVVRFVLPNMPSVSWGRVGADPGFADGSAGEFLDSVAHGCPSHHGADGVTFLPCGISVWVPPTHPARTGDVVRMD